ncbi:MAG: hypothetical protein V4717_12655 [Bacteroidota bacterium]
MKKRSYKIRTILVGLVATIVSIGITVPAFANQKNKNAASLSTIQPAVTFLGSENNNALFSVALVNEAPVKFELLIEDASGEVIFKQDYEASKFSKVFKLVNEDLGGSPSGLSFKILVKPTGVIHNFEVNSTFQTINEVAITKL